MSSGNKFKLCRRIKKNTMQKLIILRTKYIKYVTQLLNICVYMLFCSSDHWSNTTSYFKRDEKNWKKSGLRRKKQTDPILSLSQWRDLPEDANLHLSMTLTLCLFCTLFLESLWLSYTLLFQALQMNQRSHTVYCFQTSSLFFLHSGTLPKPTLSRQINSPRVP